VGAAGGCWVLPQSPPPGPGVGGGGRNSLPQRGFSTHPSLPACSLTPGLGTRDQAGWTQRVPHQGRVLLVLHIVQLILEWRALGKGQARCWQQTAMLYPLHCPCSCAWASGWWARAATSPPYPMPPAVPSQPEGMGQTSRLLPQPFSQALGHKEGCGGTGWRGKEPPLLLKRKQKRIPQPSLSQFGGRQWDRAAGTQRTGQILRWGRPASTTGRLEREQETTWAEPDQILEGNLRGKLPGCSPVRPSRAACVMPGLRLWGWCSTECLPPRVMLYRAATAMERLLLPWLPWTMLGTGAQGPEMTLIDGARDQTSQGTGEKPDWQLGIESLCQSQHQPNQPYQLGVSSRASAQPGHVTFFSWDEAAGNLLWPCTGLGRSRGRGVWAHSAARGQGTWCVPVQVCTRRSVNLPVCAITCCHAHMQVSAVHMLLPAHGHPQLHCACGEPRELCSQGAGSEEHSPSEDTPLPAHGCLSSSGPGQLSQHGWLRGSAAALRGTDAETEAQSNAPRFPGRACKVLRAPRLSTTGHGPHTSRQHSLAPHPQQAPRTMGSRVGTSR